MTYNILIIALLNISILLFFLKRRGIFLSIIVAWWYFWLLVSSFSLTGLFIPEDNTYWYFIYMLCCVSLGGIFKMLMRGKTMEKQYENRDNPTDISIERKINLLLKVNYFLVVPVTVFFFVKAILMMQSVDLSLYRSVAFGLIQEEESLLGSGLVGLFCRFIILPLTMALFFIGLAAHVILNKKKLLIISSLCMIMDAIMMLGRGRLYIIIVFLVVIYFIKNRTRIFSVFRVKLLLRLLPFFLIIIFITSLRGANVYNLEKIINTYVITYHTCPFIIFDDEFNNPSSLLNQNTTYGRASLGAIESITVLILRRFDRSIEAVPGVIGYYLHTDRLIGYDSQGEVFANAFATIAYSLYIDGGWIFTGIFSFFWGFLLVGFSLKNFDDRRTVYNLSILLVLFYLGIFGLFQPILTGTIWITAIFIIFFLRNNSSNPEPVNNVSHSYKLT